MSQVAVPVPAAMAAIPNESLLNSRSRRLEMGRRSVSR